MCEMDKREFLCSGMLIGLRHSRIMSGSPVGVYKVRTEAIREKKCVKYLNRVLGLQGKEAIGRAGAWISRVGVTDRQ